MVGFEAQVNGRTRARSPMSGLASGARNLAGDALELAELQARLAKTDASLVVRKSVWPLVFLVLAVCGAIASLPVLTLGLASLLESLTQLNVWQSQLLVGVAIAALSSVTIYLAVRAIKRALLQFQRSMDELAKNTAWAKAVVRGPSHEPHA